MSAFTDHYRSLMRIDYKDLPYWDLCAALRLIRLMGSSVADWAAFLEPYGRHDITEDTIRGAHRRFIAQAFDSLASTTAALGSQGTEAGEDGERS